jgi:hypothetical protein
VNGVNNLRQALQDLLKEYEKNKGNPFFIKKRRKKENKLL